MKEKKKTKEKTNKTCDIERNDIKKRKKEREKGKGKEDCAQAKKQSHPQPFPKEAINRLSFSLFFSFFRCRQIRTFG